MKKKIYEKPTMNIVTLQHQTHLLAGSGVGAMRSGYGSAINESWGESVSPSPAQSVDDDDFLEFLRLNTLIN